MKTKSRRHVEAEIGMVHAMQPPKGRYRMKQNVLKIDRKVECNDRYEDCHPIRRLEDVEQSPTVLFRQQGQTDRSNRIGHAHEDCIDHDDAQVVRPADHAGDLDPSARGRHLPYGHDGKHAQKCGKAQGRFSDKDCIGHGPWLRWGCQQRGNRYDSIIRLNDL